MGLDATVEAAAEFLNKAVNPFLVGSLKISMAKAARPSSSWPTLVAIRWPRCHSRRAWSLRPTQGSLTPIEAPLASPSVLKSLNLHSNHYLVPLLSRL